MWHVLEPPCWSVSFLNIAISNCGLQTSTDLVKLSVWNCETLTTSMCNVFSSYFSFLLSARVWFSASESNWKKLRFWMQRQCRDTLLPALRMHWKSQNVKTWRTKILSCLLFVNFSVLIVFHSSHSSEVIFCSNLPCLPASWWEHPSSQGYNGHPCSLQQVGALESMCPSANSFVLQ